MRVNPDIKAIHHTIDASHTHHVLHAGPAPSCSVLQCVRDRHRVCVSKHADV